MDEIFLKEQVWPRFSRVLDRKTVYLANHSLGRPPDRMADDVRAALEIWYRDMEGAWNFWMDGREKFRELTAELVGAGHRKSIVPKTSAGQGLRAVLNALPGKPRVLTTDAEFDSLDFILKVYRQKGRIDLEVRPFEALEIEPCDLVVVSTVAFRTGQVFQGLADLIEKAHRKKAKVLLDVYHHAGALPLELAALDTGWFAKKDVFAYQRPDPPQFAPGGDAWLESTPAVIAPFQALAGLEVTLELGLAEIRRHNLVQKQLLQDLLKERGIAADGAGESHGAFLTVASNEASTLAERLQRNGIRGDARGRHLRLCPDFLNSREELERAALTLGSVFQAERTAG